MTLRGTRLTVLAMAGIVTLAGCDNGADRDAAQNLGALNVLDEAGISEIVLNFADPNEAANYFRNSLSENPNRTDFKRGYAQSLMRAKRPTEAALAYRHLMEDPKSTHLDRLAYAEALVQSNQWEEAETELGKIPPTLESYDRYRMEALLADYRQQWSKADSFYETARELTTRPAPIYNNWGISMLARGNLRGAEDKFHKALTFDPTLFSAKNNIAIARAKAGNYNLPVVPMTEIERAQLLHNMALQAIRNGDIDEARGLLQEAIDAHPQHFEEAVSKLAALDNSVAL